MFSFNFNLPCHHSNQTTVKYNPACSRKCLFLAALPSRHFLAKKPDRHLLMQAPITKCAIHCRYITPIWFGPNWILRRGNIRWRKMDHWFGPMTCLRSWQPCKQGDWSGKWIEKVPIFIANLSRSQRVFLSR